jgi:hypothetical protein
MYSMAREDPICCHFDTDTILTMLYGPCLIVEKHIQAQLGPILCSGLGKNCKVPQPQVRPRLVQLDVSAFQICSAGGKT